MSKPEHTESPEPVAAQPGAGEADPAQPVAAQPRAGGADPAEPSEAAADAGPAAAKPKPAAAKPVAAKADLAKPVAAAEAADAEPVGAKPVVEPEDAKPAAAKADPAKPAALAEPSDAKPVGAKPVAAAEAADAEPVGAKPVAEPADAKPAAAKADLAKPAAARAGGAEAKPVAEPVDAKPAGGTSVTVKADAVAAEVKARAEAGKAAAAGQDKGRLLAGRYRLGSVLGKGGMGTVWRAEDEILGRTVAVKELRFSTGVDEDEKRRLITRTLREAKAIARIRSGGAVTVYDVVDEDARPWIVMELIEGSSLAEFIRENGPLTPRRAAEVGLAVLDVLRAAHGQGILHRDVKPSNVLIAGSGRVVLTDFGIAQVEGDPSVTSTGMLVGAPSYISPERARGHKPGPPADMWSLGGLLYASVEGTPPYDKGSALATLTAVMTEPVDPPKNAGPLTEVIYGLLAKDPAQRLDDDRARAMLTAVLDAPEPAPKPVPVPADETRQISLADAKQAAEKAAAEKAAEKAEKKERERRDREQRERARAALKAARKAAAATAPATAVSAAEPPAPSSRPAPVAAPLTDVMPRRTIALAIAGVLVVLAVVGSLIAYAVSGDDDKGGRKDEGKGGKPTPAASGAQSPGSTPATTAGGGESPKGTDPNGGANGNGTADGGGTEGGGQPGQGQQSPGTGTSQGQGQGQGSTTGGSGGVPAGYAVVTDLGFHFSMAMPEGFKQQAIAGENSGAIYSRDGGFPRIQVDYTASPGNDARLAWAKAGPAVAGSSKGYRIISLDTVEYRGYPTVADWQFEREQQGIKVRVLNRGFKVDATHGYAIMISCPADQWDGPECTQMRNTAFESFQVLG
ncbi:serine/threonine protein kinase [Streptomyces xanthophaeus]|uniref:serine/threonine-protein kinase n=1 Tax=Streptomyces xanthophaeus TaxID=67385 RepID=UPI003870D610|nr:serine/threonine protein kinase [Streptomyces xanthophaeus]WST60815.1 serine/threonine protein kinase [Streptomyces xanthophaeus]